MRALICASLDPLSAPPSVILPISEDLFASGDDEGTVKFWDAREHGRKGAADAPEARSTMTFTEHTDWITDMIWAPHIKAPPPRKSDHHNKAAKAQSQPSNVTRSRLVCVAGDGILSTIDPVAGRKGIELSEDQEDELLAVRSIKKYVAERMDACDSDSSKLTCHLHHSGDKFVVGTALGPLSIWAPSKGMLDHVDRLAGHPASIDSIDVLDQDTILTGSSDGLVRIVQV